MKKDFSTGVIDAAKAAKRLGTIATKTTICPGCGRVQVIEALTFELGVIERSIKEVTSLKADGVKWCEACR